MDEDHTSIQCAPGDDHCQRLICDDVHICCNGCCLHLRYGIVALALSGFFCALSARGCISVAIIAMANTTDTRDELNNTEDRCPAPDGQNATVVPPSSQNAAAFDWSPDRQSLILGVFYYGYVVSQVPGGYLACRWKPQHVFSLSVLLSGIFCALLPFLAHLSSGAVVACRFFMGLMQGPLFPANAALFARWSPVEERSKMMTLSVAAGTSIGNIVSPVVTGYFCSLDFLGGWPLPFYLFGGLSCLWFILWMFVARHDVAEHPWISDTEKQLIGNSLHSSEDNLFSCPPWGHMFTSLAVYALLLHTFFDGLGYYIIYNCYPLYMKTVLNYDIEQDSLLTTAPHVSALVGSVFAGVAADFVITKQWFSVTATRKAFTFVGGFIQAVFFVAVGFVNCDRWLAVTLVTIGWLFGGFIAAGPPVSVLDMSPQHAGVLNGIVNSVNNVGGFLSPLIVVELTNGQPSRSEWRIVFFVTASSFAAGALCYLVLGSSKEQSWSTKDSNTESDAVNAPLLNRSPDELLQSTTYGTTA